MSEATLASSTAGARSRAERLSASPRAPLVVLALMLLGTGIWLMLITRGTTFHYDEWSLVLNRRGTGADIFLQPHNEHIITLPVFIWKALLETVGLRAYWPYQLMPIALHVACGGFVYALARRPLGAWWALVPAGVVLMFGAGWEDILWPFQIGFLIPVAAFLAALLAVQRDRLAWDLVAAALMLAGVLSGSVAIPLLGALGLYLLLQPEPFGRRAVRIAVTCAPAALFYLWWNVEYGVTRESQELAKLPSLVADLLAAHMVGLSGLGERYGAVLAVLAVAAVLIYVVRGHALTPRLVAFGLGALAVMAAFALFRGSFLSSRYLYPGAILLVLLFAEIAAPALARRRLSGRALGALAVAGVVVVAGGIANYRVGEDYFQNWARFTATSMGALEIARDRAGAEFVPDPVRAPDVSAARYFNVTADFGSSADSSAEIAERPEDARQNADIVLTHALAIDQRRAARPDPPGPVPATGAAMNVRTAEEDGCVRARATAPTAVGQTVEVRVDPGAGIWVRADAGTRAELRLRRFAEGFTAADLPPGADLFPGFAKEGTPRDFLRPLVMKPPAGQGVAVETPADRAPDRPWTARLALSGGGGAVVCALS